MDYIAGVVAPLSRIDHGFMRNSDALSLLESTCDSKLAIMDHTGEIATVGNFTEIDGVLYSNLNHLNTWSNWSSYGKWWEDELAKDDALWEGSKWYEEPDDGYKDYEDELIQALPFDACKSCEGCYSCIYDEPYCTTSDDADYVARTLFEEYEEVDV